MQEKSTRLDESSRKICHNLAKIGENCHKMPKFEAKVAPVLDLADGAPLGGLIDLVTGGDQGHRVREREENDRNTGWIVGFWIVGFGPSDLYR